MIEENILTVWVGAVEKEIRNVKKKTTAGDVVRALVEEQLSSILNCSKTSDLRNRVPALSGLIGSENFCLRRIGRKPKIQEDLSHTSLIFNLQKRNEEELHLRINERESENFYSFFTQADFRRQRV